MTEGHFTMKRLDARQVVIQIVVIHCSSGGKSFMKAVLFTTVDFA